MNLNKELIIVTRFNESLESLIMQFATMFPNSSLGKHLNVILALTSETKEVITDEDGSKLKARSGSVLIYQFINHVLEFKEKIDNSDESFFLKHDYDDKIKDLNINSDMNFIDEFKEVWTKLGSDDKETVFAFMQYLCELSLEYFQMKDN